MPRISMWWRLETAQEPYKKINKKERDKVQI